MEMGFRTRSNGTSQLGLPFVSDREKCDCGVKIGRKHAVAALFAGIGGLELGLGRAGHQTTLFCENDPGAKQVLCERFPDVCLHDDVSTLESVPDSTTLITAGFPCQDLSQAGAAKGITAAKSGLVREVFRLAARHRTESVLLENVPFMLQLGRGEAMGVIASAFENLGYRWAYRVVDSRSFGLPQRRRRVYFLASRISDPRTILFADEAGDVYAPESGCQDVACGFYWTEGLRGLGWAVNAVPTLKGGSSIGIPSPPAILFTDGRIATPDIRDAERLQGFPVDWTKPAEKAGRCSLRWKLVGNAVSVPVAGWLGYRLANPGVLEDFEEIPLRLDGQWPNAAWNVGYGRMIVGASEWPVRLPYCALQDFLIYPCTALSARATRGFLQRALRGKLRFPPKFLDAVRCHLLRLTSEVHAERTSNMEAPRVALQDAEVAADGGALVSKPDSAAR
jgi:DNA (cytosine-5)-methyltransferase 1